VKQLPTSREGLQVWQADALDLLRSLTPESVDLICTSPPYAMQRAKQYGGIPEADYPAWTVAWLEAACTALKPEGSVVINIREHVSDGELSDYVHRTRLAVRAAGWVECDELVWVKPASPPVGHPRRPRRSWERVLWFAKSRQPWCNPQANGVYSERLGMDGASGNAREWVGGVTEAYSQGVARCPDFVAIATGYRLNTKHPATFPPTFAAWLIRLLCPPEGTVVDPFLGSGSTAVACVREGRRFVGGDIREDYCETATLRIQYEAEHSGVLTQMEHVAEAVAKGPAQAVLRL
jgi:site-specific DNA-methyltransferase (adenine-specific)